MICIKGTAPASEGNAVPTRRLWAKALQPAEYDLSVRFRFFWSYVPTNSVSAPATTSRLTPPCTEFFRRQQLCSSQRMTWWRATIATRVVYILFYLIHVLVSSSVVFLFVFVCVCVMCVCVCVGAPHVLIRKIVLLDLLQIQNGGTLLCLDSLIQSKLTIGALLENTVFFSQRTQFYTSFFQHQSSCQNPGWNTTSQTPPEEKMWNTIWTLMAVLDSVRGFVFHAPGLHCLTVDQYSIS